VDNIQTLYTEEEVFSIEDLEFGIKWLAKGKATWTLKGIKLKSLKLEGLSSSLTFTISSIMVKNGFPKSWTQILIVPIFKSRDKNNPSN
jgi:hypothetical protein